MSTVNILCENMWIKSYTFRYCKKVQQDYFIHKTEELKYKNQNSYQDHILSHFFWNGKYMRCLQTVYSI